QARGSARPAANHAPGGDQSENRARAGVDDLAIVARADRRDHRVMDRRAFIGMVGGSVLAGPLAAEGQQTGKIYRLGWFAFSPPTNPEIAALHDAFLQELRAQGFVEGQNVRIERRYIEGREERATALAAELVGMKVDLIFATYSGAVRAAKDATSTIPIVMGL